MTTTSFGILPDGQQVTRATISAHGMTASVITLGASLQDLRLQGVPHPLVLGFATLAPYLTEGRYFGAIVGRCANRIAHGKVQIDGQSYALDCNERGQTTLHGGADGTGQRNWPIVDQGPDRVTMADHLPDGHMGFPGALQVRVSYQLLPGPKLQIDIVATAEAPTICNFAQHSFFNLDGSDSLAEHHLCVQAADYLPVDTDLVPLGPRAPVDGTHLDFRTPVLLGTRLSGPLIDHNLCVGTATRTHPIEVATLSAGKLQMAIHSTEPGLQVYAGDHLQPGATGIGGLPYRRHGGIALESQLWPDAPHHSGYPSALLRPGETYRQTTRLSFASSPGC